MYQLLKRIFQFHYGTIKSLTEKTLRPTKLFQFHYGTIKRQMIGQAIAPVNAFQFHYGTIKR
mgnify:CR=1 FL=1